MRSIKNKILWGLTVSSLMLPFSVSADVLYTFTSSDNNHSDFTTDASVIQWVHPCSDINGQVTSVEFEMISTGATTNIDSTINSVAASTEAVTGGGYTSYAFTLGTPVDCTSGNLTVDLQRNGGDETWVRGHSSTGDGSTITCSSGATCNGLDSFVVIVNGTSGSSGGGSGTTTTSGSEMSTTLLLALLAQFILMYFVIS